MKIAETADGLGIYKYRFRGSPLVEIGLMAQEVEKVKPDAVVEIDGVKHVHYGRALT